MPLPCLPKTVKVGLHDYSVLWKSANQLLEAHGEEADGLCCDAELEIWLKRGMRRSKTKEILWHELSHACLYASQIKELATEEEYISALAPTQLAVLRENPALITYLTGE